MRIAIFSETFLPTPDGVAHFLGNFSRQLVKMGHEPHIFTTGRLIGGDGDAEGYIHRFKSIKFPLYAQYRISPEPFIGALRTVKKLDVDVIHIHTPFFMGTAGFICSRVLEIPLVGTFHTNFLDMADSISSSTIFRGFVHFAWKYTRGIYRRCSLLTTSSSSTAELLNQKFRREVLVIPHGIDVERFSHSAEMIDIRERHDVDGDAAIITYLGRLTRDKGVDTLLDAFVTVRKRRKACLVIAGIGPERSALEEKARALGIGVDTRFTGYVDEMEKISLLRQSDVVVLVSKADLVPLVLVEAMACGTPVIGSRAGGIPNLIEDGRTGILVEEGDPKELSDRVLDVLSSSDLTEMKSNAMKHVAQNFSTEVTTKAFLDIYRRSLRLHEQGNEMSS